MISSRLDTTKKLVESLNRVEKKDKLFISTSAVGIYDNKAKYDENGSFSNDFLSTLCQNWEKEAQKAKSESTKVAIFRFGIVLGKNGGAFQKMITPFKLRSWWNYRKWKTTLFIYSHRRFDGSL